MSKNEVEKHNDNLTEVAEMIYNFKMDIEGIKGVLDQVAHKVRAEYEPVQLEVLNEEERAKVWSDYYSGGAVDIEKVDYDEYLSQATVSYNEAKGQLYRLRE